MSAQAPLEHIHVTHLNKSHFIHLTSKTNSYIYNIAGTTSALSKQTPGLAGTLIGPFNKSNSKSPNTAF